MGGHIDPDNLIAEANEDDNEFSTAARSRATNIVLNVDTSNADVTNIIIKEFVLEETTIVLDLEDYDATAAHTLDLTAEFPHHGNTHVHGHAEIIIEGPVPTHAVLDQIS